MVATTNNIRGLRVVKGISASSLASIMNVSRPTILNWETGKTYPKATQLEKLNDVLGENIIFFAQSDNKASVNSDTK